MAHGIAHYRNEHNELVPACICGWETSHAHYGDTQTIYTLADKDWEEHVRDVGGNV